MAHTQTHTHTIAAWDGMVELLQLFSHANANVSLLALLGVAFPLPPSASNIYMQIDRTLVPLCHCERHTQKEISTKRQMLQYYRALSLSVPALPWVAAANAGGFATVAPPTFCLLPSSLLPAACSLLPAIPCADFSCLPCYALKWQKNRWSRKNYCSWQLEADISHSQADAAHTHTHARTHTHTPTHAQIKCACDKNKVTAKTIANLCN